MLVPSKPGLFVLAEESEIRFGAEATHLTLLQISQVEDLETAMARLLLPTAPNARFVRYAVLEDEDERRIDHSALKEWMASSPNPRMKHPTT